MGRKSFLEISRKPQETLESLTRNPTLNDAIERLSTLISASHSIIVFALKWQLIRSKLEELNSDLLSAQNSTSGENPAISGLLRSLMATIRECYDLARRCSDLSFSGKLLMQSDLDIMLGKFDLHAKSLAEIYNSGTLTPGHAIVVSRPLIGACKDDMRFYVRDLLTRMKVGDLGIKKQALVGLLEVVKEDEKYVRILVEVGGVVNVLVGFLDLSEPQVQEEAVRVVSVISGFDSYKAVLIGAGVIAPLIRVLECGNELGKEMAARCLMKLTENSDNAWSVSAHGGVTAVLKICASEFSKPELISPSCGVLRNLVGVEEIKRFMVDEGAVSIFIKLLRSKDDIVQLNSIDFLQSMASGDESVRQLVIKEGGIRAFLHILDPSLPPSSKLLEVSLRAIENMCFNSASGVNMLLNCGFLELLLHYLRNGEASVQEIALKVASRICSTTEEAKKALGDSGFMPEIIKFLDAKSFEVREMAAEALSALVMVPKNRKRFVQEEQNIINLLRLLEPEEGNSRYKKFLLSTLSTITSCSSARRKIVNSGYLKNIEKLADAEVSDAKKLVRKLSTNRFRIMLSGIWHS